MKKKLLQFVTLICLCVMVLPFSSCKNDEPDTPKSNLTGTWENFQSSASGSQTYSLVLNSNNTGVITQTITTRAELTIVGKETFNWTTSEDANGNRWLDIIRTGGDDYILTDEDNPSVSYIYVVAGNTLSFGGLVFNRK